MVIVILPVLDHTAHAQRVTGHLTVEHGLDVIDFSFMRA